MKKLRHARRNGACWFLPVTAFVDRRFSMPFRISLGDAQHALAFWIILPETGNLLIEVSEFRNRFSPRFEDQRALLSAPFLRWSLQRGANIRGHRIDRKSVVRERV